MSKHDARPEIISKDELAAGLALQEKLNALKAQRESVSSAWLTERRKDAIRAYQSSPTETNFETLKRVTIEFVGLDQDLIIRDAINVAKRTLNREEITPWAEPIVLRALEVARNKLSRVTDEENERHLAAIGKPAAGSAIIAFARNEVKRWEAIAERIVPNSGSPVEPAALIEMLKSV